MNVQIGTSSVVYPAAGYTSMISDRNIPVVEINIETTPSTSLAKSFERFSFSRRFHCSSLVFIFMHLLHKFFHNYYRKISEKKRMNFIEIFIFSSKNKTFSNSFFFHFRLRIEKMCEKKNSMKTIEHSLVVRSTSNMSKWKCYFSLSIEGRIDSWMFG